MVAIRLTEKAFAKLNISLDVTGELPGGYHAVKMVMESVGLCDDVYIEIGHGEGISVRTNLSYLPCDNRNLAAQAAKVFFAETGITGRRLAIRIYKRIPVCAGMAGGSSDAAAVLRGLNRLCCAGLSGAALAHMGAEIGSDVPYCVAGGTALAEGRGEVLTPLPPLRRCHFVLCKPRFSLSTPALFQRLDRVRIRHRPDTDGIIRGLEEGNLEEVSHRMYNVFEDVLGRERDEVRRIKDMLLRFGALGAAMSGTGPTVFGIFEGLERAKAAYCNLKGKYRDSFLVNNISRHELP